LNTGDIRVGENEKIIFCFKERRENTIWAIFKWKRFLQFRILLLYNKKRRREIPAVFFVYLINYAKTAFLRFVPYTALLSATIIGSTD